MKLNSTVQTTLICVIALYVATFLMEAGELTKNGLLIGLILGIFMVIGIWRTIKSRRKYKYFDGLGVAVQGAIFSLLSFAILSFVFSFFLTVLGGAFGIEALSNYMNTFIAKLPSLIVSVVTTAPFMLVLLFTIPAVFLLTNRNKQVWED